MAQTKEKLVSKDAAKILRKMGHNDWCDCYYHVDNDDPDDYEMGNNQVCNDNFEEYHKRVAAPYVSQALLWLMQFKGIAIETKTYYDANSESGFYYSVKLMFGDENYVSGTNIDYQEALYMAIDSLLFGTAISDEYRNLMFIKKEE